MNLLVPNSFVNTPVYLDEGFVLATPETAIRPELIQALQDWSWTEVLADDHLTSQSVGDLVATDTSGALQEDAEDSKAREETQKFYSDFLEFTHKLFDTFLKRNQVPIEPLTEQVKLMISVLRKNRRFVLRLNDLDRSGFSYIVSHSVNVSILAIALGDTMRLPPHKLIELGMAGLLHEIGMFKLPDTFQNANRPLTELERRAVSAHPLLGYRVLRDLGFAPNVTLAVLEHHEREDGSGYPQGLTGEKIAMSAKILAVASAYDAQIVARPFRTARSGHATLLELLKDSKRGYDEQIIRRLVFILSLYPIGSYVELKNGAVAFVYDANPDDPKRPTLRLLSDEAHNPLRENPLFIANGQVEFEVKRVLTSDEVQRLRADKIIPA